uniref:Cytochrome P450 n=1 Tax=Kalanchoe fedtschenkoi TaxID=63787 RepID=A0A7N0RIX9_KALFE
MIILPLLLALWLVASLSRTKRYTSALLPPSPPRLPVIGNLHQLGEHAHQSLRSLALTHGPLMLIHLGSVPAYVVSSAEIAREMLKTHDIIFSNRSDSYIFRRLLYDGKDILLAPYGEYWRHIRAIGVLQLLSSRRVQSYQAVREEEIALMIENIKGSDSSIDLSKMLGTLTNDILCRIAFGKKYSQGEGEEKFKKLFDEFGELLGVFNIGEYIPWLKWLNHLNGLNARVDRNFLEFDKLLDQIFDDHIATRSEEGPKEHDQMDLLDVLLDNQHDAGITDVTIARTNMKAILADMFAGGSDTTYAALEWAMTELVKHPTAMTKVQKQIRQIVGERRSVTKEDLQKMDYLKAVIKETLRMHPPIPLMPRISSQQVKLHGFNIPAHTRVFINITAIGRDAERWDEPDEFRPERFLDAGACDSRAQEFDFMPFGGGRRGCPGVTFATAVMELVLANLLHCFDWSLPDGARGEELDVEETSGLSVHKKNPLILVAYCY